MNVIPSKVEIDALAGLYLEAAGKAEEADALVDTYRAQLAEMVDRHGFAPCSPACKAGDLLNDRAAQLEVARRLGAAPSPRSFGDSAAQAGARRTRCVF